jgi:hypothetical protein
VALSVLSLLAVQLALSWSPWATVTVPRPEASGWLLVVTALLFRAVVRRWEPFLRFLLAASWVLLVSPSRPPVVLAVLCHAGTALFLLRHLAARRRKPAAAETV